MIQTFEAGPWRTNCWIVSDGPGTECFIVDPGMDSADRIRETVEGQRLKPIAVLLTHGHIDHMFSVLPVADGYGIPALVHGSDRDRLGNPYGKMTADTRQMVKALGVEFAEPADVVDLHHGFVETIAGFDISVHHAPGHTEGSISFRVEGAPLLFTGDTLFPGGPGATKFEGGDFATIIDSIDNRLFTLPAHTVVLPGHGVDTTIGAERPHLQEWVDRGW